MEKNILEQLNVLADNIRQVSLTGAQEEFITRCLSDIGDYLQEESPPKPKIDHDMTMLLIEHIGTELPPITLRVGRSFFEVDFGNKKIFVNVVDNNSTIELIAPSVEGTVLLCQLADGKQIFYKTTSGEILKETELRQLDPHFYC